MTPSKNLHCHRPRERGNIVFTGPGPSRPEGVNMRTMSAAAAAIAALLVCACETTRQQTETGFHPPKGTYHLIVMQPDVTAGLLTAGGVGEPREDWAKPARD